MNMSRRTVIAGATGLTALAVAACTPRPAPTPTTEPTVRPPWPTGIARSSWSHDPFSQGATSYLAVGATLAHRAGLAQPVAARLFFAGEATSVEAPNSLDGARATGAHMASMIEAVARPGERVAVIGAGIAGAACAHALRGADLDVIVIEARDRVGGRVHTLEGSEWNVPVEMGGMRVPSDAANATRIALAEAGWPTRAADSATRRAADGATINDGGQHEAVLERAKAAADSFGFDVPLSTAVSALGDLSGDSAVASLSEEEALSAALAELVGGRSGALARQISAQSGLDELTPPWQAIVDGSLQEHISGLLEGVDIFLSSAVTAVLYDDDGVAIRMATGESISVDRVVVTVPLAVLKDGGITFEPALPSAHREAIARLGVGHLETVALRFDEAAWSETAAVWHLDPTDDSLVSEWVNLQALAGSPVLVGVIGPQRLARVELLDDESLIEQLMIELAPFVRSE